MSTITPKGIVTAIDDTLSATQDTSVNYAAWQLLANDVLVGFPNSDLSISSVTSGFGGTAVLNPDGTVTFTPSDDFSGTATFSYTATDTTLRVVDLASLASTKGVVLQGQTGDYAGWSVSPAGDVNGDGFADVIVGAPRDVGDPIGGRAY